MERATICAETNGMIKRRTIAVAYMEKKAQRSVRTTRQL